MKRLFHKPAGDPLGLLRERIPDLLRSTSGVRVIAEGNE